MKRILVVDDDDAIRKPLVEILKANDYDAVGASCGTEALDIAKTNQLDLAILDIMMPMMNGYVLCDKLHDHYGDLPVIFLSAKGDIVDKAVGFRSGADDYVTKPFDSEELLMRIEAVLRRFSGPKPLNGSGESVQLGDLAIFPKRYQATVDGREVTLTAKEFELLAYLASYTGQVFTRTQIYQEVWGEPSMGDDGIVTVYIRKIREQIEQDPKHPRHLLTVWGVGYKLV